MKALPAEFIVAEAERDGRIGKNTVIVETSSGSFALGLALACRKRSLRLGVCPRKNFWLGEQEKAPHDH
jgi:cysteine synthase A